MPQPVQLPEFHVEIDHGMPGISRGWQVVIAVCSKSTGKQRSPNHRSFTARPLARSHGEARRGDEGRRAACVGGIQLDGLLFTTG